MGGRDLIARGIAYGKNYGVGRLGRKALEHVENKKAEAGYEGWLSAHLPSERELFLQREESAGKDGPLLSVIVPIYRTPEKFLREMIESVLAQSYSRLELCLADGSGEDMSAEKIIREYAEKDHRVRYERLAANGGISGNTNAAFQMAEGDFLCLLDHDDLLTSNALYELAAAIRRDPSLDALYTDEDKVDCRGIRHFQPHFKPDFNLDLLRSNNYICHLFCVRRELAEKTGGFRRAYDGAQDYDFILRCAELAGKIGHVPQILYHWRCHSASTAENPDSKRYAYEAGKRAVEAHLKRCRIHAAVVYTDNPGFYRVRYALKEDPRVRVIPLGGEYVPETFGQLRRRLTAATDYSGMSICSEQSAKQFLKKWMEQSGEERNMEDPGSDGFLLFLNASAHPMNRGWLRELVSHGIREDAGAVTGRIYDRHRRLLHAGEVIGMFGQVADCPFRGTLSGFYGYMHKIGIQQDFSAVTGDCLLIRESVLRKVISKNTGLTGKSGTESFDPWESKSGSWNVDLCVALGKMGLRCIYTPFSVLELWGDEQRVPALSDYLAACPEEWVCGFETPDGAYNENLSWECGGWKRSCLLEK